MRRVLSSKLLTAGLTVSALGALHGQSLVEFTQVTDPPGFFSHTTDYTTGTQVKSRTAPVISGDYHFYEWRLGDVRQQDHLGVSINPFSFTIFEPTTATAHYVLTDQDADADGVNDWFELTFFGDLNQTGESDADADGFPLTAELYRGYHPKHADEIVEGGVSRRQSGVVSLNLIGDPTYAFLSSPTGFVNISATVTVGTGIASPDLWLDNDNGYRFAYWEIDGAVQSAPNGMALGRLELVITEDITAMAVYLPEEEDSDGDSLPDWYEWNYFSDLGEDASSDADGDQWTLATERFRGYHPLHIDELVEGGVSRRQSSVVALNLANYFNYALVSEPAGFVDRSASVSGGTVITTADLWMDYQSGYRFAYWEIEGVKQAAADGRASGQLQLNISADVTATAIYLLEDGDSDGDAIPDWFEYNQFLNLDEDAASDADNDGFTLVQEWRRGYDPLAQDTIVEGGISRRQSGVARLDLQVFERLDKMQLDGVLSDIFSPDRSQVSGMYFGDYSATAVTDWDQDGDFDLFIASNSGLTVWRNVGSATFPNFEDYSGAFISLSNDIAELDRPLLAGGDFNGDGIGDLVIGGAGGVLRLIQSNRSFAHSGNGQTLVTGFSLAAPALADLNGDGLDDLLVLNENGAVRLYLNSGASTPFSEISQENLLGAPVVGGISLGVGDIDQDGRVDILAADNEGRLWEFHQNPEGGFNLVSKVWGWTYPGFASAAAIAPWDIEGDGDLDLVAGMANGGLLALRDPRIGRPTGLVALPGAQSIKLSWDPSWQSRIVGYYLYRSAEESGPFQELTGLAPLPQFVDEMINPGEGYYYYATAVSQFLAPGNSSPQLFETLPSEFAVVEGEDDPGPVLAGEVHVQLRNMRAKTGKPVDVMLSLDNAKDLAGDGMEFVISYDPAVLIPITQHDSHEDTVVPSGLSKPISFSDNSASADGQLVIQGNGGESRGGRGKFLTINFWVQPGVANLSHTQVTVTSATLFSTIGHPVATKLNYESTANIIIDVQHVKGDLDADGDADADDYGILKSFLSIFSPPPTPAQLEAGDLNGDGYITIHDLILHKQLTR